MSIFCPCNNIAEAGDFIEKEVYLARTVLKAGNPRPVRSISAASGESIAMSMCGGSHMVRPEVKDSQESDFQGFFFLFNLCRSYLESLKATSVFSEDVHTEA